MATQPVGSTRRGLGGAMLLLFSAWIVDLPARLGVAVYTEQFLALVVGLATALALLDRRGARWHDIALAAIALIVFAVVALRYPALQASSATTPPTTVLLGGCMVATVLEATRRRFGWFLPGLVLGVAGLVFAGGWLPTGLEPRPVEAGRMLVYLGLDSNALLGRILATAAAVIAPFIVFGALFAALGGSGRLAAMVTKRLGRQRGGAAKVAVAGSAAFGMLSGSAVANVAAVGSVSIPMMMRAGYPRHTAGAVEAVASTGGQLMPPVMGASAFLMAELLELSYRSVVLAALIPALTYYVALWVAVDLEARREARLPTPADARRPAGPSGLGARFLLPVVLLLYLLFVAGWTADLAGAVGVLALVACALPGPRNALRERALRSGRALLEAMDAVADIVLIGAAAGLVIGLLDVSGLSFALTLQTVELGRGSLAALLAVTAVLCVLLGMGMPTVGVYALLATLVAPALVELGVPPLAAHLYVLYFGMFSMITPPVALASFAAAAIAGAPVWRTSMASLRLAAGALLVPVAFVLQPALLLTGTTTAALLAALRLLLAVTLMSAAAQGHAQGPLSGRRRALAAVLALTNIAPLDHPRWTVLAWLGLAAGLALLVSLRAAREARA